LEHKGDRHLAVGQHRQSTDWQRNFDVHPADPDKQVQLEAQVPLLIS
jgi:hypothetical protein